MNTIKFSCPECGGEVFDTSFKPQALTVSREPSAKIVVTL